MEEVAEIKRRRKGRRKSRAERRESRALPPQEAGSRRSCCSQGSQRLHTPAQTLIMASPDDPLRSGKVARCRALTWAVTTSRICQTELQSHREPFWATGLWPDVSSWMGTPVARTLPLPIPPLCLPLCEQQLTLASCALQSVRGPSPHAEARPSAFVLGHAGAGLKQV